MDAGGVKELLLSFASLGFSYLGSLTTALGAPRKKRRTDDGDEDYADDNEDCCEDFYDGLDVSEEEVVAASQIVHEEKTEEEIAAAMAVLEAAQAKALKVKGLNFWSEDSRKHYHELLPGVWSMNTQYGVGGYLKVMDLLLDVIDQKEKDPSIDVAAIVAQILKCGVGVIDGPSWCLAGRVPEEERDEYNSSPTGSMVRMVSQSLPFMAKGPDLGNGLNTIQIEARVNECRRVIDLKTGKITKGTHCVGWQPLEVIQVARILEEWAAYMYKTYGTKLFLVGGGGDGADPLFYGLDQFSQSQCIYSQGLGVPHCSTFTSVSRYSEEGMIEGMKKATTRARELSERYAMVGVRIAEHCHSKNVEVVMPEESLFDSMLKSTITCNVADHNDGKARAVVEGRLFQQRSKGGKGNKGKKQSKEHKEKISLSVSKVKIDKAQKEYLVHAKDGTKQVYYIRCGQPGCNAETENFGTKRQINDKFSINCPCLPRPDPTKAKPRHSNWIVLYTLLKGVDVVWAEVEDLDEETKVLCGQGLPGVDSANQPEDEKYGCGAKARKVFKSNYAPESCAFCEECESKLTIVPSIGGLKSSDEESSEEESKEEVSVRDDEMDTEMEANEEENEEDDEEYDNIPCMVCGKTEADDEDGAMWLGCGAPGCDVWVHRRCNNTPDDKEVELWCCSYECWNYGVE